MVFGEGKGSLGYGKPPWIFKGSALYQLHLVKAETARTFIPKEFRLVEAFGYTLGGFFLANYEESPAGAFDELVVIAGIVWNPPTSCAWAARVLVSSEEACHHGRKEVGLPSHVAKFSKRITPVPMRTKGKFGGFLNTIGIHRSKDCMDVQVTEVAGPAASADFCNIKLVTDVPTPKWMGPSITMSLPSFSGQTEYNLNLLKYSCRVACRVRAVQPAKIGGPLPDLNVHKDSDLETTATGLTTEEVIENRRNLSISVMLAKPLLALEFNFLEMQVEAPTILSNSTSSLQAA